MDQIEVPEEPAAFLERVVYPIPGFLHDYAALATMELLAAQDEMGIGGSLLEIGVFGGRYLAVLARQAARNGAHVVGIDPFVHHSRDQVAEWLRPALRGDAARRMRLTLIEDYSTNMLPDTLLATLGARARFVSLDGSHERADVFWDLRLVDAVVAAGGIVAIDDFTSIYDIGVSEAVFQFFLGQPRNLVPFAFIPNKLLMTTPRHAEGYRARLEQMALTHDHGVAQIFRSRFHEMGIGRRSIEAELLGHKLLVLT